MLLEHKIHRLPVIDRRTGNQFLEKRVSALPIINSSGWCINHSHYVYILRTFVTFFLGEVVDIYAKFDVIVSELYVITNVCHCYTCRI